MFSEKFNNIINHVLMIVGALIVVLAGVGVYAHLGGAISLSTVGITTLVLAHIAMLIVAFTIGRKAMKRRKDKQNEY